MRQHEVKNGLNIIQLFDIKRHINQVGRRSTIKENRMCKYIFQALVLFCFVSPVSAISEKDFFNNYQKKIVPFYNSCEQGFFSALKTKE